MQTSATSRPGRVLRLCVPLLLVACGSKSTLRTDPYADDGGSSTPPDSPPTPGVPFPNEPEPGIPPQPPEDPARPVPSTISELALEAAAASDALMELICKCAGLPSTECFEGPVIDDCQLEALSVPEAEESLVCVIDATETFRSCVGPSCTAEDLDECLEFLPECEVPRRVERRIARCDGMF